MRRKFLLSRAAFQAPVIGKSIMKGPRSYLACIRSLWHNLQVSQTFRSRAMEPKFKYSYQSNTPRLQACNFLPRPSSAISSVLHTFDRFKILVSLGTCIDFQRRARIVGRHCCFDDVPRITRTSLASPGPTKPVMRISSYSFRVLRHQSSSTPQPFIFKVEGQEHAADCSRFR